MHLSSITIKGFKSFPDRTRLVFSPGVSVIVGPNGCGKSNITDGVLWALGEQSPLAVRGQSMQDMVFAGGEGRGPSRAAEVEVVLDNGDGPGDFSEISVKRRLDRAGEGEYRLNGARCRLVDVIEVLSDANLGREMHSVISQGRVEEIVHSKPRDRRLLVEEAAGLGKHRKRRRRAQLKLERTEDNLDRALDVEREARSRLRPLKRQAQAADIHARLEREADELRGRLLASELAAGGSRLGEAENEATKARAEREGIDRELDEVGRRRSEIEERLAERDRERTEAWGRLTALRAAHERLTVRAEALAARRTELAGALERRRAALGSLADELSQEAKRADDPIGAGLERIGEALGEAGLALGRARTASSVGARVGEVGRIREAADRAARGARRVEGLLGRSRQDSLERRIEDETAILRALEQLCEAVADVRDAAGERATASERAMLGEQGGDDVTAELRSCSRREAELQAKLRAIAERVTQAEVSAAHLRDRRDETAAELERIGARLGRDLDVAEGPLEASEREQIEAKLDRLARRREQLGPVNPLAEREYQEAVAHVTELEEQRADLESALSELEGLIRETDRKIHAAFEETFEAAERNFQELVGHLFPGGRGRLRLVGERSPKLLLGGAEATEDGETAAEQLGRNPAAPGRGSTREMPEAKASGQGFRAEAEEAAGGGSEGVEIEVTPAGKATRRLSLLSGGEKSLVALAFVFSVFLARPSPFYILDEVEAALDDANIDRFLQLVRRFSDRAQFIIVTHQKRTMDAADVLYGVSMGAGGVTKVISRRMPQGEQDELAATAAAAA
jgi:chromosome segregation ATPase